MSPISGRVGFASNTHPEERKTPMNAAAPAAVSPWQGYKLSARELAHFAAAVELGFDRTPAQSDAHRFGFLAGTVVHMAMLLELIWPDATHPAIVADVADARSLAACVNTDQIAAWIVTQGRAPAGDVNQLRANGWSIGATCIAGYVFQLNHLLRAATN